MKKPRKSDATEQDVAFIRRRLNEITDRQPSLRASLQAADVHLQRAIDQYRREQSGRPYLPDVKQA